MDELSLLTDTLLLRTLLMEKFYIEVNKLENILDNVLHDFRNLSRSAHRVFEARDQRRLLHIFVHMVIDKMEIS